MEINSFLTYLELEKNYASNTIKAYENDLNGFSKFCVSKYDIEKLEEVGYQIIRSWIVELVESGKSNRSINRKISSLNSCFNFLIKTKQIHENPLKGHQSLKVPKNVNVPFTQKEIEEVLAILKEGDDFTSKRNRLIVELLYSTGMRREELIQLQLSSIDLSKGTVKVLGKRNKERYIPLLKSVNELLEEYLKVRESINSKTKELFITEKGQKIYPTLVYRLINDYFSKVSTKVKKSPHMIRHSFATHLLNEGADLNSVKELLGHSSLASTQVYTHNSLNKLKQMYNHTHPRSNKND